MSISWPFYAERLKEQHPDWKDFKYFWAWVCNGKFGLVLENDQYQKNNMTQTDGWARFNDWENRFTVSMPIFALEKVVELPVGGKFDQDFSMADSSMMTPGSFWSMRTKFHAERDEKYVYMWSGIPKGEGVIPMGSVCVPWGSFLRIPEAWRYLESEEDGKHWYDKDVRPHLIFFSDYLGGK